MQDGVPENASMVMVDFASACDIFSQTATVKLVEFILFPSIGMQICCCTTVTSKDVDLRLFVLTALYWNVLWYYIVASCSVCCFSGLHP